MYNQLTYAQRYAIERFLKNGIKKNVIASLIGVHPSTLTRELQRNGGPRSYNADKAHCEANRRKTRLQTPRKFTHRLKQRVSQLLRQYWSPDQVSGYLKEHNEAYVSAQTIYTFIKDDREAGGDLWKCCRHRMKKRRRPTTEKKISIKGRISIDERPSEADGKRFGDWEMDTIVGNNGQGAMLTITERSTNYSIIKLLPHGKNAKALAEKVWEAMAAFKGNILTITTDNGTEFAEHKAIAKRLNTNIYFAHPYASWEKGAIENYNKLVRQYIHKGTDFKNITEEKVKQIQKDINNRPRKKLNYKTPKQEFYKRLS